MKKRTIGIGEEQLVTKRGTIIPEGVGFRNGNIIVAYHVGNDAHFAPCGASMLRGGSSEWEDIEPPVHRGGASGCVGDNKALFFTQYLFRTAPGEYACLYNETHDGGCSFSGKKTAKFHIDGVLDSEYTPRDKKDPYYWFEPEIPDYYRVLTGKYGAVWGPALFGKIIRLPDGALGLSGYGCLKGNMTRTRLDVSWYVKPRGGEVESPEQVLSSALFFRSEDEGATWRGHVIASPSPNTFGADVLNSEGFSETGISVTSDGKVFALMRQGSFMPLHWTRSDDGGITWAKPAMFNYPGVAPNLCLMPCGALAAVWGRPGLTVAFDTDGTGEKWDLMSNFDKPFPSQQYGSIVSVSENRILLFYDRREYDSLNCRFYEHGIYYRDIEIGM